MSTSSPLAKPPAREARLRQGLTLREVARLADIDPAQLSRYERGQQTLSVAALHRLAQVLDPSLARVLDPYVRDGDD